MNDPAGLLVGHINLSMDVFFLCCEQDQKPATFTPP